MDERYESDGSEDESQPLDEQLDEFLCEYVDGSMDPVVQDAFEEYLAANPRLADHVRCLCQAKSFLSSHTACPHASAELQVRLREAIAQDLLGGEDEPTYRIAVSRLGATAGVISAAALFLMLGVLFGTAISQPAVGTGAVATEEVRPQVPIDAHASTLPTARVRVVKPRVASFGVMGPASALPVLATSPAFTPAEWSDAVAGPPHP